MTWHEIAAQSPKKMTPLQSHLFPTVVSLLINGKKALCGFVWVEKGWEGALVPWAWLWVSAALVSWLRLQWTLLLRGARSLRWQWGPRGPRTLILNGETTHAQTLVITAFFFFFIFFFCFFLHKRNTSRTILVILKVNVFHALLLSLTMLNLLQLQHRSWARELFAVWR